MAETREPNLLAGGVTGRMALAGGLVLVVCLARAGAFGLIGCRSVGTARNAGESIATPPNSRPQMAKPI